MQARAEIKGRYTRAYAKASKNDKGRILDEWGATRFVGSDENRLNRTREVKSVLCPHQRFSEEFKQQVVTGGR